MSRMPPIPDASKPAYGPGGVAKAFTDRPGHDTPFAQPTRDRYPDSVDRMAARSGIEPREAVDDLGGFVPGRRTSSETWMLIALGVVVAAIAWLARAGSSRRGAPD